MNIIDIIIVACVVVGCALGFRDGVIRQLGSLAGIIIAIFLAKGFGNQVAMLLKIEGDNAHIWGFVIVLILSLMAVALMTAALRKFVSAVNLGSLDRLAGAALGLIKTVLILSLTLLAFDFLNKAVELVDAEQINSSKLYSPTISVTQYIVPSIEWVGENLPTLEAKE